MRTLVTGVLALVLAACLPMARAGGPAETGRYLLVDRFPGGENLGRYVLGGDREFALTFIHSVSKTRVRDVYAIRGTGIVQTREDFMAHGAGLPSHPSEPGGISWEKRGDQFVLHMERPIPKLVVRTDKNYQNRLILGDRTVDLNQWEDQALLIYVAGD